MFCPNCGAKNEDDAAFCESCGGRISEEEPVQAQPIDAQPIYPGYSMTQVQQQPATQNYVYQQAAVATARKPLSRKVKIIGAAVLLVIILVIAFVCVGKSMSNPEKVVNSYFEQMQKQDWDKAYSCLDVTESEFINKKAYISLKKADKNQANIENFTILSSIGTSAKSSDKDLTSDETTNQKGLAKEFEVQYTVKGSSAPKTAYITLVKQKAKALLFFDTWKVSSDDMISPSYTIEVPKGLKVSLDGVQIPDTYLEKADSNDKENTNVSYKLKNIFTGTHKLKASSDFTEDYTKDIDVMGSNGSTLVHEVTFKQNVVDTVGKQAGDTLTAIYNAATAGKSFSEVKQYFSSDADVQTSMQSKYESVVNTISKDGKTSGLKKITFSDFKSEATNQQYNGMKLELETSYKYTYTTVRASYFSDQPAEEHTSPSAESGRNSFVFVLQDGKWVIEDAGSFTIYCY